MSDHFSGKSRRPSRSRPMCRLIVGGSFAAAVAIALPAASAEPTALPHAAAQPKQKAAVVDGHHAQPSSNAIRPSGGAELTPEDAKEVDELARELLSMPASGLPRHPPEVI